MEEILASIRRIIADEPTKISRNEGSRNDSRRSEGVRSESLRNESPRNEPRHNEGPRSESLSDESSRHEGPARSIAPEEDAPAARGPILPQPPPPPGSKSSRMESSRLESSRLAPQPRPPIPSVRAAPAPPPDPATQQEEIDAMLAQLHAGSRRAPPEEPASDILELTEQMEAQESLPVAEFAASDDLAEPDYEEETPTEPAEESHPVAQAPAAAEPYRHISDQVRDVDRESERRSEHHIGRDVTEHGLISAATTAAVDSAFNTLAQTVLVQNGRTLEDLVREMLRPMLKIWLDDNLPSLVERLVRTEIERVSRGRG
jgi:cell pole-organizing protein PopZ